MSLTNQVQKEQHSSSKQRQEYIMYDKVQVQVTSTSIRETYYLKLRHIFLHIDNTDGTCAHAWSESQTVTKQIPHVILI